MSGRGTWLLCVLCLVLAPTPGFAILPVLEGVAATSQAAKQP